MMYICIGVCVCKHRQRNETQSLVKYQFLDFEKICGYVQVDEAL